MNAVLVNSITYKIAGIRGNLDDILKDFVKKYGDERERNNMGKFKIAEVQLSDIKLVKKNAHFMQQDTFNALVNNIRRDRFNLSSVPFCVKHSDGSYTV